MASFNVSENFGTWLKRQGFKVELNTGPGKRPMRVFAPVPLAGKAARAWFEAVFKRTHKGVRNACPCCEQRIHPTFPYQK